jgi:glycine oxidase
VKRQSVTVIGAGVAGLACALELAERGAKVEVVDRGRALGDGSCSWQAGGMLAPWCERATTDAVVATMGAHRSIGGCVTSPARSATAALLWRRPRDAADLTRFAQRTERFELIDADRIAALEPDLGGRFRRALFFPGEAHLDPRRALAALAMHLQDQGVAIRFGVEVAPQDAGADIVVDCRGFAARDALAGSARRARRDGGRARAPTCRCSGRCACCIRGYRLYIVPRATACS